MKKYYLTDGKETFGPFSIEELKGKELNRDAYVWFEDLEDWKIAGEIEELGGLFEPEPIEPAASETPSIQPPPIEPPPIVPPPIAAQPHMANQAHRVPEKQSVQGPPKVWPKILVAIGLPVAIFVALLLTGVIKIPGLLDGSQGSSLATGNPDRDALTMIQMQENFARAANDIARDGVIDSSEMNKLETIYKDILVFFGSYSGNSDAQNQMDEFIERNHADRANKAEKEFERAMKNLMDCEGFDELSNRMERLVERLNINFDD